MGKPEPHNLVVPKPHQYPELKLFSASDFGIKKLNSLLYELI
jgi:hypothetical protein